MLFEGGGGIVLETRTVLDKYPFLLRMSSVHLPHPLHVFVFFSSRVSPPISFPPAAV